ncbi:MAG: hypothetical protein JWP92_3697 [Caulobacter sp.]|nr:hypothetical protein [Caulobacter sp.]
MSERVTKAAMTQAIAAMSAAGRPVLALRLCANGDMLLLTETPAGALPVADNDGGNDWTTLAGAPEISRA